MEETADQFELGPSRIAAIWIAVVHAGAVASLFGSAVPPAAGGVLTAIVALSFVRSLRLHAFRCARKAVVRIELGPTLRIGFADGTEAAAHLRTPPLVHCRLVVFRLASDAGRTVVLVPPDALRSPADHKTLRRHVRHGTES